ncbi:hypothetical protein DAPPUDRAFT_252558 [Daphnia pulex]|uniref:Uncharacterized protein n=1 Tax=Daphnia pulex TaxID=6669 RepID=E9H2Z3_DAPPU|nr:hypothetical protein DAPPUDRAFT_252558 [Daphnia pulex]|eukprot:EFX73927.1 hypothetical protein DAPPUDRAFT_252558 [Daphnia pulex]
MSSSLPSIYKLWDRENTQSSLSSPPCFTMFKLTSPSFPMNTVMYTRYIRLMIK